MIIIIKVAFFSSAILIQRLHMADVRARAPYRCSAMATANCPSVQYTVCHFQNWNISLRPLDIGKESYVLP